MRLIYYNVTVKLKEAVRGIHTHRYNLCDKVRYRMKGDNAKIWFYDRNGNVTIKEFSNVASVEIKKCK